MAHKSSKKHTLQARAKHWLIGGEPTCLQNSQSKSRHRFTEYFAGKKRKRKKKSIHLPGHKNVDKLGVGEELGVHTLLDPLEDGTSSGLCGDLTPQLRLDTHEREDKAKAPVLQDLQHALLLLVNFCRANQVRVTTEAAPFPKAAADTGDVS